MRSREGAASAMTERELGTYQMLWDCPRCETQRLLGLDHRHCPSCGAAQDPKLRYFPSEADKIAARDHRYTGADKVCPACETPTSALANHCPSCGSPLEGAASAPLRREQGAGEGAAFLPDSARVAKEERRAERVGREGETDKAQRPHRLRVVLIGVVLALVFIGAALSLTWKKAVEVTVLGHEWVRTIAIEEVRLVPDIAWRDQLPFGAREVSCHREQRSTRRLEDGQTCTRRRRDLGDGTFKEVEECRPRYREEPIYDQRCAFVIDRWVQVREVTVEGHALTEAPRWPEIVLRRTGQCIGCEREGRRSERYELRLLLLPAREERRCVLPEPKWKAFAVGRTVAAKARVVGGGLDCDSIGDR